MNQFPQEVGLHILGGAGPDLDFCHRDQHLVTDDFHLARVSLRRDSLKEKEEHRHDDLLSIRSVARIDIEKWVI